MQIIRDPILDDLIVSIRELFGQESFCVFKDCFSKENYFVYFGTLDFCRCLN